jgi:two-component system response regulator AtoC
LREQVEALERSVIARTLSSVAGNQSEAARRLGLSRGSLIDRLKKYGFAGSSTDSTA